MATKSTTQTAEEIGFNASLGLKLRRIYYTAIADAEDVTPLRDDSNKDVTSTIVYAAFEPDDSGDDVNVTIENPVTAPDTITFNVGAGGPHSGYVWLLSNG